MSGVVNGKNSSFFISQPYSDGSKVGISALFANDQTCSWWYVHTIRGIEKLQGLEAKSGIHIWLENCLKIQSGFHLEDFQRRCLFRIPLNVTAWSDNSTVAFSRPRYSQTALISKYSVDDVCTYRNHCLQLVLHTVDEYYVCFFMIIFCNSLVTHRKVELCFE